MRGVNRYPVSHGGGNNSADNNFPLASMAAVVLDSNLLSRHVRVLQHVASLIKDSGL